MSTIRWRSWSREAIPDERTLKSVAIMAEYLLPAKLRKDPSAMGIEGKHMQIQWQVYEQQWRLLSLSGLTLNSFCLWLVLGFVSFCLFVSFDWLWTRDGVIGVASDVPRDATAHLQGRHWAVFQLASSNLLTLEQFPALCFTTANTRTAGHLGHSCAITSSSFIILMRPDYEKLKMNPLISWNTSGYKHNCGALWEPNRRESHPKNNSFSFTLQWTNWKK